MTHNYLEWKLNYDKANSSRNTPPLITKIIKHSDDEEDDSVPNLIKLLDHVNKQLEDISIDDILGVTVEHMDQPRDDLGRFASTDGGAIKSKGMSGRRTTRVEGDRKSFTTPGGNVINKTQRGEIKKDIRSVGQSLGMKIFLGPINKPRATRAIERAMESRRNKKEIRDLVEKDFNRYLQEENINPNTVPPRERNKAINDVTEQVYKNVIGRHSISVSGARAAITARRNR